MKLTKIKNCAGKTIVGTCYSISDDSVVISYSDGCYSVLGCRRNYEDIEIEDTYLSIDNFFEGHLVKIGLKDEVDRILLEKTEQSRKATAHREWVERQEYERLKKKFES